MKKYIIGIVTYQPDEQRLSENLATALSNSQASMIVIADNHSDNISAIHHIIDGNPRIMLLEHPRNMGIAFALNSICRYALDNGYEWLLTLDQDSVLQPHILDEYDRYTAQADIAIVCPRIEDRNMGRQYAHSDHGTEYVDLCITSGNLVRLQAWQHVGGFLEPLFIDGVDFEFCLRLLSHGYRILRTNNVALTQEIGTGHTITLPFHHQISILNHSPLRLYYMTRNYLYIGKSYHQQLHWTAEVAKRMLIVLLFEHDKLRKLRHMFTGINHYRKGILGECQG